MPAFSPDDELAQRPDFLILRDGHVRLFWKPEVLREAVGWFTEHGYRVVELEAGAWLTQADMHRDVAEALDFPDYYGKNLDALVDCLRDVASLEYGASADDAGLLVVLSRFDMWMQREPDLAQAVVDILTRAGRLALVYGNRLLCFVQSDDPDLQFAPVGATPVLWNMKEWLYSKRHPKQEP